MGVGFATEKIPKLIEPLPGGDKLIDSIEFIVGWARANSLWPLIYGTACCAMEMMSAGSSRHDWARFGVEVARATPRQADLIILAGTIVEKMADNLVTLYKQMPGPKYVIAMGACSISGGPFYYDSYSVIRGGDRLIPVDVYIPGCPPRPETLLYGIMELQKKIRQEGRHNPWQIRDINTNPIIDPLTFAKQGWEAMEKQKEQESAAAREQFRKENPDYKPAKPKRLVKEKFLSVDPAPSVSKGLDRKAISALVMAEFPDANLDYPAENEKNNAISPTAPLPHYTISSSQYVDFIIFLKENEELAMDMLLQVTAVDWQDRIEVMVHLLSCSRGHKIFVRCVVDRQTPAIDSICHIFRGAEWHEREVYDLFGVHFNNHPDLRRIFLPDDFPGHPLRKDFEDPERVIKRPY